MVSKQEKNYKYINQIINEVVQKKLAGLFIKKWDDGYETLYGKWDNEEHCGQLFCKLEASSKRSIKGFIRTQFESGDTSHWDCSALFDAILNSNSIGNNPKIYEKDVWDAVTDLQSLRNILVHEKQNSLSDNEFQDFFGKIEKSFAVLNFSKTEMNEIKAQRNRSNSFCVLPSQPNHFVVERTELRDQIINDLEKLSINSKNELTYFFISGNPGSGKSQLVRQVLEKKFKSCNFLEGASFVSTLDGKDVDSLLKTYRELCYRLNCDKLRIKKIMEENIAIKDKAKNLRSLVCTQIDIWEKWWIIVDNVVQLREIFSLLPKIGEPKWMNGQIVLTVQNTDAIPENKVMSKHISISHGMNSYECLQLLNHYNQNENVENEILNVVINTLDSQPLALAAAGYYFSSANKANKTFSWNNYLKELSSGEQDKMNDPHAKINYDYPRTMFQATFLAVRANAENSPLLKKIFRFLSLVSLDPIPRDILNQYIQSVDNTKSDKDQALVFTHCSLFLYTESHDIRLHRVVHDAIIKYTREHSHVEKIMEVGRNTSFSQNLLCQIVQALYNFKSRDDQIKLIPHLNLFLEHLQTYKFKLETNNLKFLNYFLSMLRFFGKHYITLKYLDKFEEEAFEFNSDVKAWCFTELGYSYDCTGQFCKAEIFFKKALESRKKIFGEIHADVASSLNDLGLLYRRTGRYEDAKEVHEKALDIRKQLFDPDHVDIATSLMNLGRVYDRTGEYDKAKEVQQKAVEIREKLLPRDPADLADALNHLGLIYDKSGEYEEAKEVHTKSADIREKVLGPDHPDVATSLSNLGLIYDKIGDYDTAEKVHTKAIKIQENYFGIDHPEVAMSLNNLGFIYDKTGKYDKAKEVHQRALKIREDSLGPEHVDVAWSLNSLGFVYEKTGEYDKGIEAQKKSVEIRKKALGPDHPDVATSLNGLGWVYEKAGEYKKAEEAHKTALEIREKVLGTYNPDVATSLNSLGWLYEKTGEYDKAKKVLEKALKIRKKTLGSDHADVATSLNSLGLVYEKSGDFEKANKLVKNALDIRKKVLNPNHADVATSLYSLGLVCEKTREFEKALKCHEQALEIRKKILTPDHVDIATSFYNLGLVYDKTGEYHKAMEFHEKALEIRKSTLRKEHADVVKSLNSLALVYDKIGEYDKSKECRKKYLSLDHPNQRN